MAEQLNVFDPLRDFEDRLPYTPSCGSSKRIEHILPREEARAYPYIQVNWPRIDYLCFDLDYHGAAMRYREIDIPGPTLTIVTRDSGHAHLLYELYDPIPREYNKATRALLKSVIFGYREMLCADKVITTQRQLVKNPLSPAWDVLTGYKKFTLSELAESIPPRVTKRRIQAVPYSSKDMRVKSFEETLVPESRNCSLFDNARFYAYTMAYECGSHDALYQAVLNWIIHLNDEEIPKYFPIKLNSMSELRGIASSISSWTFQRRSWFRYIDEGAMGFPSMRGTYWEREEFEKEIRRRRRLSAKRTHSMRKEITRGKIRSAVEYCLENGIKPTVTIISSLAKVSRPTVYKYKDEMEV